MSVTTSHRDVQPPVTASPAPAAPAAPSVSEVPPPSFDIVRINPKGEAVIAGRAAPKAEVVILDGGKELGRVTADNRGEWVFVPDKPLDPGNRELSLRATNPDGSVKESASPVIIVVPERGKNEGASLAVKVNPDGSVELLQGPEAKEGAGTISIAAIKYDDHNRLSVSGTAPEGATVRVYVDNQALGHAVADADGRWHVAPKYALKGGSHTVRADQIGKDGKVVARAEITFTPAGELPPEGKIVVVTGNSLWRIARRAYGTGYDYLVIYQANKGQIRDPNLIYPGQVFTLPGNQ